MLWQRSMHKITLNKYLSVQTIDIECTVNVFQDSVVKTGTFSIDSLRCSGLKNLNLIFGVEKLLN